MLDHHVVVWAEASAPGVPTRMHAASGLTGRPLQTPAALQPLRNVAGLYTDGRRIAYPNASYRSLWWSPSLNKKPYEVVGTRHVFDHIDNSVRVGGRYVGFGKQPHVFVADTKTGRYVEVGKTFGFVYVDSAALLVVYGGGKKVLHPILRMSFVPLTDLPPMPACR
jgi:hypothetical protein